MIVVQRRPITTLLYITFEIATTRGKKKTKMINKEITLQQQD